MILLINNNYQVSNETNYDVAIRRARNKKKPKSGTRPFTSDIQFPLLRTTTTIICQVKHDIEATNKKTGVIN